MHPRNIVLPLMVAVLMLGAVWLTPSLSAQTNAVDCTQFYEEAIASTDGNFCELRAPALQFINVIESDNTGRIWLGTERQGLVLLEKGQIRNWQAASIDMRADAIRGMAINDQYVVVGLFSCGECGGVGLYDIEQDTWTSFFPEEGGLGSGGVGGVAIDQNSRVYMPTSAGTLDIWAENGSWQHFAPEEATPNAPYIYFGNSSDAVFDSTGNLYVGYAGLKKFDGQEWLNAPSFPTDGVNSIAIDQHGYLWIATTQGLVVGNEAEGWKVVPSVPTSGTSPSQPTMDSVKDVAIDKEGRVWIVGDTTLAAFNGQTWERVENPSDDTVWGNTLAFDADGNLWVEKDQALAVFTGETTLSPPLYQSITDIAGTVAVEEAPNRTSSQPRIPTWFLVTGLIFMCGGLLFLAFVVFYLVRTRPKPSPIE